MRLLVAVGEERSESLHCLDASLEIIVIFVYSFFKPIGELLDDSLLAQVSTEHHAFEKSEPFFYIGQSTFKDDLIHEGMNNLGRACFDCGQQEIDLIAATAIELNHRHACLFVVAMANPGPGFVAARWNIHFDVIERFTASWKQHDALSALVVVRFDSVSAAVEDGTPDEVAISTDGKGGFRAVLFCGYGYDVAFQGDIDVLKPCFNLSPDVRQRRCAGDKHDLLSRARSDLEGQRFERLVGNGELADAPNGRRFPVAFLELFNDLGKHVNEVTPVARLDDEIGPPAGGQQITLSVAQPIFYMCFAHFDYPPLLVLLWYIRTGVSYVSIEICIVSMVGVIIAKEASDSISFDCQVYRTKEQKYTVSDMVLETVC